MAEKCKECGCKCTRCIIDDREYCDMHLHVEIENLRQRLLERDSHIVTMETHFLNEAEKFPNGELASIKEEILIWQEKYSRLYEAHKRVQKVNQNLEDKLLKIVDKCETEKGTFTKDIATLSHRLADANYTIHRLTQDNEKYRNDVNLAIQLLQCKPSNFVGQKYDTLPAEVQAKVRTYVAHKRASKDTASPNVKSIIVPISTFPPTAMVYNVTKTAMEKNSDEDENDESKPPVDIVSAAIMAKVLEDREKERVFSKHCDTCTCHRSILLIDAESQTTNTVEPCNECSLKYMQNEETSSESVKKANACFNGKINQSSNVNSMHFKLNHDNVDNEKVHNNNNSTKPTNCQHVCIKDNKLGNKNCRALENLKDAHHINVNAKSILNKKYSMHWEDLPINVLDQYELKDAEKQISSLKSNTSIGINSIVSTMSGSDVTTANTTVTVTANTAPISASATNGNKNKQNRINKRSDSKIDVMCNENHWNQCNKNSSYDLLGNIDQRVDPRNKEQSQIDIINDRIWKNEWTKLRSEVHTNDNQQKENSSSETGLNVINDRIWKNNRAWQESAHLTLIEVKNIDNVISNKECTQVEVATSPSYSSDSIVISTSDPPSSSSDIVQSNNGLQQICNVNNGKPTCHNRVVGPRNCLVRVTSGSKNILLDNAEHYKSMPYDSSNNKSNSTLMHTKKSFASGSVRSNSSNSENNSPILLHDNNQLQRVAEWVQSSVCTENSTPTDSKSYNKSKVDSDSKMKKQSCFLTYTEEPSLNCKDFQGSKVFDNKIDDNQRSDNSFHTVNIENAEKKDKDLITFDVPNENEKCRSILKESSCADNNYEVKITREMEETYLKLAASLDPVTLAFSDSTNADLTIEKYRKNYKRLHVQRSQDKLGSTS